MLIHCPNSTITESSSRLPLPVISTVRILLCLALAGCSANDETVAPPLPQAPTIVAQPTVVVSDFGARITATVNPNNLDTEWYFEYGPTTTYGRRLPVKSIQARLNDIVVSDTIANLGVDTTYHCRLVATNSAGTTHSIDKAFSVANTPPTILSETSVSVFGNTAILTATVNANSRSTDCYFEYGPNTSYGTRTAAKSIGAAGNGVVVRDTIKSLSWDSTYHCRLVAENAAGKTNGSDRSFICSSAVWTDFVFPLDAGTTWNYAYSYSYRHVGGTQYETRGHQVWRSIGFLTPNTVKILLTRVDTTYSWYSMVGADTTTRITQADTSFVIIVSPDSLQIQWYRLSNYFSSSPYIPGLFKIPRYVEQGKTTITYDNTAGSATFVSGSGLTSYVMRNNTMYQIEERLILQSVSAE